jgi:hypothetical protein
MDKKRFDINLLSKTLQLCNAKLIGEYTRLNRDSRIKFKCNCGKENEKVFETMYNNSSAYCEDCLKRIKKEKFIKVHIEKYLQKYLKYLKETCEENEASLLGKYENIVDDSEIRFACKCGKEDSKRFGSIVANNLILCKECMKIHGKEKLKRTSQEKFGTDNPLENKEVIAKRKQTMINTYGVEYPLQVKEILKRTQETNLQKYGNRFIGQVESCKEKAKETNLQKYGTEYTFQSESVKIKIEQTMIERHSVINISQSTEIKEKKAETTFKNFGVRNPSQCPEIQQKKIETSLERYGTESPSHCEEIKAKVRATNLKRCGYEYHAQSPEFQAKLQRKAFKRKEYIMPSGNIRIVQGYEPWALEILISDFDEEQIFTDREYIPFIPYELEGKNKVYIPDIYIPHINKIIEVKSTYTYIAKNGNVQLKAEATRKLGYDYEIWIFGDKGEFYTEKEYKKYQSAKNSTTNKTLSKLEIVDDF